MHSGLFHLTRKTVFMILTKVPFSDTASTGNREAINNKYDNATSLRANYTTTPTHMKVLPTNFTIDSG